MIIKEHIEATWINQVREHCLKGLPFVLFHDERNYLVFYPTALIVECWDGEGLQASTRVPEPIFIDGIKKAVPLYEGFHSLKSKEGKEQKVTIAVKNNFIENGI